jgi:dolichol kinase
MPSPGVSRALFHLVTGLLLVLLVQATGRGAGLWILGSGLTLVGIAEGVRLAVPSINRFLVERFGYLLKVEERSRPTGVGFFLAGVWLVLFLCDLEIALLSMIILAAGDPAAAVVGKRWGRIRIGQKTLEGTLAFCVVAWTLGWVFQGIGFDYSLSILALGVASAALVELMPLRIDDNLILPLAAGLVMQTASGLV